MVQSFGQLEAARILQARQKESDKRDWQIRKAEMLRARAPIFFEKIAEILESDVADFNKTLGLDDRQALRVSHAGYVIELCKKGTPFFYRKAICHAPDSVTIRTQSTKGFREHVESRDMIFDISSDDDVTLDEMSFVEVAASLLNGVTDLFR